MELEILNNLVLFRTAELTMLMLGITSLGSDVIPLAVLLAAVIFFIYKKKHFQEALLIAASLALSQLLAHSIKFLLQRPRPPLEGAVYEESGYAMPSSHAFLAAAFYGMIFYQLAQLLPKGIARNLVYLSGLILILLIAFSRMYLGVHWPTDVIAGLLGGLLLNLFLLWFAKQQSKRKVKKASK